MTSKFDSDDLKIVFSLFDTNHDGKIDKQEINELVSFIAGDVAKVDDVLRFMQAIDTNHDGVITMDEFEILITKHLRMNPLGVRNLFNTFDLNGDGFVDRNEFNQVIKDKAESFHERQIKFFKKVLTREDTDKVSYQQFLDNSLEHYRDYVAKRDN